MEKITLTKNGNDITTLTKVLHKERPEDAIWLIENNGNCYYIDDYAIGSFIKNYLEENQL